MAPAQATTPWAAWHRKSRTRALCCFRRRSRFRSPRLWRRMWSAFFVFPASRCFCSSARSWLRRWPLTLRAVALGSQQVTQPLAVAFPVAVRAGLGVALVHTNGLRAAGFGAARIVFVDGIMDFQLPIVLQDDAELTGRRMLFPGQNGDAPSAFQALHVDPCASVPDLCGVGPRLQHDPIRHARSAAASASAGAGTNPRSSGSARQRVQTVAFSFVAFRVVPNGRPAPWPLPGRRGCRPTRPAAWCAPARPAIQAWRISRGVCPAVGHPPHRCQASPRTRPHRVATWNANPTTPTCPTPSGTGSAPCTRGCPIEVPRRTLVHGYFQVWCAHGLCPRIGTARAAAPGPRAGRPRPAPASSTARR